jgi:CP family cyanate transporter-like MFS transporter
VSRSISPAVVFLLGLNLRPAVTSLGSALPDVVASPGMTSVIAAVLVALPLWACGIGGLLTPWFQSLAGTSRAVTSALVIVVVALTVRVGDGPVLLVAGTALACLAIAVIGTVLPVLVRSSPGRLGAYYTLALGCGSTAGALITPAVSSWRIGLAVWAALALVAAVAWRRADVPDAGQRVQNPFVLRRSGTAWALTLYFGLTSTVTFVVMGWLPAMLRAAGLSEAAAGGCLALAMVLGLPMMWLVPLWARRWRRQSLLVAALTLPTMLAIGGLFFAPAAAPWVWATGLGIGMGGIALALTSIPLRAGNDQAVTTALSAMVQGGGYLIAGLGALACGLLHSAGRTWHGPLILIFLILCGQAVAGLVAVRPTVLRVDRPNMGRLNRGPRSRCSFLRRMLRALSVSSREVFNARGQR